MRELEGEWIMKKEMRMISKDGTISEFPGYTSSKEEENEEEEEEEDKEEEKEDGPSNDENPDIVAIIAQQLQTIIPQIVTQVTNNVNNENANGGNGGNGGTNGCLTRHSWLVIPETMMGKVVQARGHEAAIGMKWVDFKALLMEEFCPSNEIEKLESEFWNHTMIRANHAGYTDRFHELAKLVPHLAGRLTNEAVRCGTLTRSSEKRKEEEEISKQRGSWKDNKKAKVGKGFVAIAPPRNENFVPLLNVKPSIVSPGYIIEVANGKKEEVDRIIRMDWLSKNKVEIVCHEKVVRIPLESGEILRVQGNVL
ncbi:hypothetical protein Tco_0430911 [Tanacetum coccineum]